MKIINYADILAVPCFLIQIIYFYKKKSITYLEIFLLLFNIIGFSLDLLFSIYFIKKLNN